MNIDHDDDITNFSGNRPFEDVLDANLRRRRVLQGGLVTAAAFIAGGGSSAAALAPAGEAGTAAATGAVSPSLQGGGINFTGIAASTADTIRVPAGYSWEAVLKWGEPIRSGGPAWRSDASNSAVEQLEQIGTGHDGMHLFPLPEEDGKQAGLMCINHEYAIDSQMFPDGTENWTQEKTRKSQNSMGISVVKIVQEADGWQIVDSPYNRRITPNTAMRFQGPAKRNRLVKTPKDPKGRRPRGTWNNCGNGYTPWDTYLTTEENFNGYFHVAEDAVLSDEQAAINERYGVAGTGFGVLWATTDNRFQADGDNAQEPNRFGYIVEIDPFDPDAKPIKRTALGRFKHEAAEFTEGRRGQAVVYMGDDQRFDYVYKWVSSRPWRRLVKNGKSPLDRGRLFVAKFNDDGTGEWLLLRQGQGPLTAENGFNNQGDVCVKTRLAADLLGATPMDRPEWISVNPNNNDVYCNMTNNSRREEANAANPRIENSGGHCVRISEAGGDNASRADFTWDLAFISTNGDADDGSNVPADAAFGSPDGLAFDDSGLLWIQTDGSQPDDAHNQMVAYDPDTGEFARFLTGPAGCEVTGFAWSADRTTMFVNIQHPGDDGPPTNHTPPHLAPSGVRRRTSFSPYSEKSTSTP